MEHASSRSHEASPQSGLGVGCKRCFSSKKLRGLCVRAQARRISISLSFSVAEGFLVPVSLAQRDEARRVEVQYRVSVKGALCLSSSLFKSLQRRYAVQLQGRLRHILYTSFGKSDEVQYGRAAPIWKEI